MEEAAAFVVQSSRVFFEQQAAVTFNAAQRRFEVVRDGVREGLQLLRLSAERSGAFVHTLLQLGVEPVKRHFGAPSSPPFDQEEDDELRLDGHYSEGADDAASVLFPERRLSEADDTAGRKVG